eukprot:1949114-Alexandrium_andersonii.AAC.1
MSASLVGSEMCIRDRSGQIRRSGGSSPYPSSGTPKLGARPRHTSRTVSYTHLTLPTICSV